MGTIIRLLIMKFLPARIAWVVGAFVLARVLTNRRERPTDPGRQPTVRYW